MKPVLRYAEKLTHDPGAIRRADTEAILAAGWEEAAIYHAAAVTALFNFMNRLVGEHQSHERGSSTQCHERLRRIRRQLPRASSAELRRYLVDGPRQLHAASTQRPPIHGGDCLQPGHPGGIDHQRRHQTSCRRAKRPGLRARPGPPRDRDRDGDRVHDTLRLRRTGKGPMRALSLVRERHGLRYPLVGLRGVVDDRRQQERPVGCHKVRTATASFHSRRKYPSTRACAFCGDDRDEEDAAGRGAIDRSGSTGGAVSVRSVTLERQLLGELSDRSGVQATSSGIRHRPADGVG
jgi:hypothetical protein